MHILKIVTVSLMGLLFGNMFDNPANGFVVAALFGILNEVIDILEVLKNGKS